MAALRFAHVTSSVGPMWVAETDAGVAACSRADAPEAFLAGLRRRYPGVEPVADAVDISWLEGGAPASLDLTGLSAFDARVYRVVRDIPSGDTLTYGDVAALIGSPGAARAVGGAMSRCPLFPAVPCHRVVRAADGWSGWRGDVSLKRRLLTTEHGASATSGLGASRSDLVNRTHDRGEVVEEDLVSRLEEDETACRP